MDVILPVLNICICNVDGVYFQCRLITVKNGHLQNHESFSKMDGIRKEAIMAYLSHFTPKLQGQSLYNCADLFGVLHKRRAT